MKYKIVLILITISFLACTKEIELKTKDATPLLVVNSIICPDSVFKVQVSKSTPITSNEKREISNANVSLFANGNFVNTLIYDENGYYTIGIKPIIGKQYELKVEANGFKEVSAKETILDTTKIIDFTYISNTGYDPINQVNQCDVNIRFKDKGSEKNYYEIILYTISSDEIHNYYPNYYIYFDNLILNNEGDKEYNPTSIFFSDDLFNGTTCDFTIKIGDRNVSENNVLYAILRTTTYNYYQYRKLWTRHQNNQNQGIDFYQDIFRGEPIEMFTNINSGAGIFAGYSQDVKKAKIISNQK